MKIVIPVIREHNTNGVPCGNYTIWTLNLTLTLTRTRYT